MWMWDGIIWTAILKVTSIAQRSGQTMISFDNFLHEPLVTNGHSFHKFTYFIFTSCVKNTIVHNYASKFVGSMLEYKIIACLL